MDQPLIRRAHPQDCDALARLAEDTFRESFIDDFGIAYPAADLAIFVPATYGPEVTAAAIADPALGLWVAEAGSELVAYAMAGPCTLPYPEAAPGDGELKRLYVRKGWQGYGLGRTLMELALDWLERDGPRPLWIGVWSGNLKAQRFYRRYGFEKFGEHEFPVGQWRDQEFAFRRSPA